MKRIKVKSVNVNILKELSEKMPEKGEYAKSKFPKFDKWLSGEDYPTYNQLVKLSKIFYIPFGYFFLEKLPERKFPIPHYRTLQYGDFKPSSELLDTILFAQKVQEWAKEILSEWGQEKFYFCGKFRNNYNMKEVVEELKRMFKIEKNWASRKSTWTNALNYLIEMAEEKGIIVLRNGVVGNNSHRKLMVDEFRGFVLYDDIAPVVFINNNDAISAKIFTLIHEVVHILIGQSASFDLRYLRSADNQVEKFCDRCAAEFLVPEKDIKSVYSKIKDLEELAKHFKVSQIVILRRLLDVSLIEQVEFLVQLEKLYAKEIKKSKGYGGDIYLTIHNRLSKRFLHIIYSAVENNTILFRDALRITNLKSKTFYKIIQSVI